MTTQTEEYSNKFGISQSSIKDWYIKSPMQWKKIWIDGEKDPTKNEENFVFGTLLDTVMYNREQINDKFLIKDIKLPSKAIVDIVTTIFDKIKSYNEEIVRNNEILPTPVQELQVSLEDNQDLILEVILNYQEGEGWQNNWKEDTRVKKLIEKGSELFNLLKEADNRKIITTRLYKDSLECASKLENDENTREYFIPIEGVELLFQLEIFCTFFINGLEIKLKGALDTLKIDHNNRTVQIADLKTTQSAYLFKDIAKKYKYCDQLSFYLLLLKEWIKDSPYKDYEILLPINIVIDANEKTPYIYEYTKLDLDIVREGNEKYGIKLYKPCKGYINTIQEIQWHIDNNIWNKSKELYENAKIILEINY